MVYAERRQVIIWVIDGLIDIMSKWLNAVQNFLLVGPVNLN